MQSIEKLRLCAHIDLLASESAEMSSMWLRIRWSRHVAVDVATLHEYRRRVIFLATSGQERVAALLL